ncbi:MAG: DJ-1/PfpI family protein [Opitutales bacterium]|jgi:protease I|nr:DJ-1/PfpI family protein [Opitutales bacterium]MDG2170420.1 DJ-1/PfpI family protein [Opitutales bacterium]
MSNKLLIVTGDGGESYEVLYALHRFQEANWEVDIAAPSVRTLNLVRHDFMPGWDTYFEGPGYGADSTVTFADVNVDDYKAVLLIGGRAPEYLRNDPVVIQIVRDFHAQDKWIYSICHGIQILATAGLCQDKKITCYEHCKFEAESQGGTWMSDEAYMDGKMICGQTWLSHPDFYRLIFDNLPS